MKKHVKNYFIPHEGNDYRPHMLQRVAVLLMLCLVLISFVSANLQSMLWMSSDWLVSAILPAVIVDLTNGERTGIAEPALHRNSVLDHAARLKAADMAAHSYFAHYSPAGISPWHWFDAVGYDFVHAGENLAVFFTDSDEVVDAWMDSPGHRANILSEKYTEIGVGTAKGTYRGYETVFVVQLFGAPAPGIPPASSVSEGTENASLAEKPEAADVDTAYSEESLVASAETSMDTDPRSESTSIPAAGEETAASSGGAPVIVSDLATSSREREEGSLQGAGDPPTASESAAIAPESDSHPFARAATKPHLVLEILYGMISLVVLFALVSSVIIEWRRQHPVGIAYGTGLLAVMALLLYVHATLVGGAVIL